MTRIRIQLRWTEEFERDCAHRAIHDSELALLKRHLCANPILGVPLDGEKELRIWTTGRYMVVFASFPKDELIILFRLFDRSEPEPQLSRKVKRLLTELGREIAKESVKKQIGL